MYKKEIVSTQEPFDLLLAWLDPNRETAGRKYKVIHHGLVRIFVSRGFADAEGLADETINRVVALMPKVKDEPAGERAPFFYKVARYIMLEARRRPEVATDAFPTLAANENSSGQVPDSLSECLDLLPEEKRDLILDYHLYRGREKVEQHERMAKERRITVEGLRLRAHRIRKFLKDCMRERKQGHVKERKASQKSLLKGH